MTKSNLQNPERAVVSACDLRPEVVKELFGDLLDHLNLEIVREPTPEAEWGTGLRHRHFLRPKAEGAGVDGEEKR